MIQAYCTLPPVKRKEPRSTVGRFRVLYGVDNKAMMTRTAVQIRVDSLAYTLIDNTLTAVWPYVCRMTADHLQISRNCSNSYCLSFQLLSYSDTCVQPQLPMQAPNRNKKLRQLKMSAKNCANWNVSLMALLLCACPQFLMVIKCQTTDKEQLLNRYPKMSKAQTGKRSQSPPSDHAGLVFLNKNEKRVSCLVQQVNQHVPLATAITACTCHCGTTMYLFLCLIRRATAE